MGWIIIGAFTLLFLLVLFIIFLVLKKKKIRIKRKIIWIPILACVLVYNVVFFAVIPSVRKSLVKFETMEASYRFYHLTTEGIMLSLEGNESGVLLLEEDGEYTLQMYIKENGSWEQLDNHSQTVFWHPYTNASCSIYQPQGFNDYYVFILSSGEEEKTVSDSEGSAFDCCIKEYTGTECKFFAYLAHLAEIPSDYRIYVGDETIDVEITEPDVFSNAISEFFSNLFK